MNKAAIKEIQARVGAEPDGFWGPQSTRRCQEHLRALMPNQHPFPLSDRESLERFYGKPGDESQLTTINVTGLGLLYAGKPVSSVRCHKKISIQLLSALTELSSFDEGRAALREYAGVYNNRSVRGGSTPSLHAYGAAIDLSPDTNGNSTHWPTGAMMPLSVMEVFARHGFMPVGAFWSRDAMHFQATRSR